MAACSVARLRVLTADWSTQQATEWDSPAGLWSVASAAVHCCHHWPWLSSHPRRRVGLRSERSSDSLPNIDVSDLCSLSRSTRCAWMHRSAPCCQLHTRRRRFDIETVILWCQKFTVNSLKFASEFFMLYQKICQLCYWKIFDVEFITCSKLCHMDFKISQFNNKDIF